MGPATANGTIGNARLSAGLGSLRLGGAQVAQPAICAGGVLQISTKMVGSSPILIQVINFEIAIRTLAAAKTRARVPLDKAKSGGSTGQTVAQPFKEPVEVALRSAEIRVLFPTLRVRVPHTRCTRLP